ncbi:ankyrin-3-like [Oscarella lobularis]|uniref:ankyrin-3-like n=1 Tax=Oscarella lobularis TaxID=121494 RepID=UPI0033132EC2
MGQDVSSTGLAQAHFLEAARNGDVQKASYVFKRCPKGVLASAKDSEGNGALAIAARNGNLPLVEYLLAKRFDANDAGQNEWTALHWAAAEDRVDVAKFLLQKGASMEAKDKDGLTPFLRAVYSGKNAMVDFLMKEGCNVSAKSNLGSGPLAFASVNGHFPLVCLFVMNKFDVREVHQHQWTALHCAAAGDHVEVVEFLLDNGAEPEAVDMHGMTPLLTAVHRRNVNATRYLIRYGCNVLAKTAKGNGIITVAVAAGFIPTLKLLFTESSAVRDAVNCKDENGQTAFHYACKMGQLESAGLLLGSKANIDAQDHAGYTPLHLAASEGLLRVVEFLLMNHCNRNKRTEEGHLAIDLARYKGHHHVVRFLVEERRDAETRNDHQTPPKKLQPQQQNHAVSEPRKLPLTRTSTSYSSYERNSSSPSRLIIEKETKLELRQLKERCDKALLLLQDQERRHNATVEELLQTHERHRTEMEEMERAIEGLQSLVKDQQSRLQQQENELDQLRHTREHLMNSLEAKELELAERSEAYDDLRQATSVRDRDDEVERLRGVVSTLEAEKTEANEEAEKLDAKLRSISKKRQGKEDEDGSLCIPAEELQLMMETKLGEGSFGAVFLGFWRGSPVAVKIFSQATLTEENRRLYERELSITSRIRHPNVVTLCGIAKEAGRAVGIVSEQMEASLATIIVAARRSRRYLTFRERADLAIGYLGGIAYLHAIRPNPVSHGDIRPSKILVTPVLTAKISGDFGGASIAGESLSFESERVPYLAPERFPDDDDDDKRVPRKSLASDVYSAGVTTIEMWTGHRAERRSRIQQLEGVQDSTLRGLCLAMIDRNSTGRPDAMEALSIVQLLKGNSTYEKCPPKRMVMGVLHSDVVLLTDKPFN